MQYYQSRRDKLNESQASKNFMVNIKQSNSVLGEVTLLERVDASVEEKRNKDLYEVAIPPGYDHGVHWLNSLRQNEPNVERDGHF
jgi:hypothetical protein